MKGGGWPDGRGQREREGEKVICILILSNCAQDCLFAKGDPTEHFTSGRWRAGGPGERERGMGGDERDDMHKQN